jgi:hypothetical protein
MTLKQRLSAGPAVVAPGVYDALTAAVATEAGFEALYVSGAAIAYTPLGRSDIGLVSMTEVAETVALIRDRTALPCPALGGRRGQRLRQCAEYPAGQPGAGHAVGHPAGAPE